MSTIKRLLKSTIIKIQNWYHHPELLHLDDMYLDKILRYIRDIDNFTNARLVCKSFCNHLDQQVPDPELVFMTHNALIRRYDLPVLHNADYQNFLDPKFCHGIVIEIDRIVALASTLSGPSYDYACQLFLQLLNNNLFRDNEAFHRYLFYKIAARGLYVNQYYQYKITNASSTIRNIAHSDHIIINSGARCLSSHQPSKDAIFGKTEVKYDKRGFTELDTQYPNLKLDLPIRRYVNLYWLAVGHGGNVAKKILEGDLSELSHEQVEDIKFLVRAIDPTKITADDVEQLTKFWPVIQRYGFKDFLARHDIDLHTGSLYV